MTVTKRGIYKELIRHGYNFGLVKAIYKTYICSIRDEDAFDNAIRCFTDLFYNIQHNAHIQKYISSKPKKTNTQTSKLIFRGIYQIKNIKTNECYIGSSNNFRDRFESHKHLLRAGKHHCKPLQRSWDKWGEQSFKFYRREYVKDDELLKFKEREWIEKISNNHIVLNEGNPVNDKDYKIYLLEKKIARLQRRLNAS